jgi:hypothetical protein
MMNRSRQITLAVLASIVASCSTDAFVLNQRPTFSVISATSSTQLAAKKGFSSQPEKIGKSEGQIKRETESARYDEIADKAGGQEYNVFVRQFGSTDQSWLPCGAVAVPRGAQVSDAIYANEAALKAAITRSYIKLKGFEGEFEFGFNLKIYPDDPVEVATKGAAKVAGLSFGNWVSTLFSPVDASAVNRPQPPSSD